MANDTINIFYKQLRIGDYNIRPFNANKTWEFTSDFIDMRKSPSEPNDMVWSNINTTWINMVKRWILTLNTPNVSITNQLNSIDDNITINAFRFYYPENDKYFGNILNVSSSLYTNDYPHQPIDPKILWYYLDHNFYKDHSAEKFASLAIDDDKSNVLAATGSILVLPRNLYGEGIKRNTFQMTIKNPDTSLEYVIKDDGYGNIIDDSFDENNFVDYRAQLLSIGFNEKYREYNFVNRKNPYVMDTSNNINEVKVGNVRNITYTEGIPTSDTEVPTGVAANFDGTYLEVVNSEIFNFTNDLDFAFSFWIKIPETPPATGYTWDDVDTNWFGLMSSWISNVDVETINVSTYNPIFTKNSVYLQDKFSSQTGTRLFKKYETINQFPFDISFIGNVGDNPYSIVFAQSSDVERVDVISSQLTPDTWTHVVCQKIGGEYQIWLNGQLDSTVSTDIINSIQNNRDFLIGGDGGSKYMSGSLDEIKIFGKSLTENEILHLSDNNSNSGYAYQTSKIGSIFYDSGIVVVSDFRPKYTNIFLGKTGIMDYENNDYGFNSSFKTATTLYEHEVVCRIPKTEFNMTQNTSTYTKYNKKQKPKSFMSNKQFRPYFTTIGLYDEVGHLLAIAKLATPIKKRKDIDINIIVRFDM
jgi:hypothetical protein